MNDVFASRATQFQPNSYEEVDLIIKESKQDTRRAQFSLVGKLANKQIFFKSDNYLICQTLNQGQIRFDIQQFMDQRPFRQKEVKRFKESVLDKNDIGYYFLYNWISNKKYCCKQPTGGPALLAFYVINLQFQKAENYIEKLPGSLQLSIIKNILKKLSKLQLLIKGSEKLNPIHSSARSKNDTNFKDIQKQKIEKLFFKREVFIMEILQQNTTMKSVQLKGMKYQNLFQNSSYFSDLKQNQKIAQLKQNYDSVIQFSHQISQDNIQNDYYKVILAFVSNKQNTQVQNPFYTLLLKLKNLQLADRLNFAQKLLTLQQKAKFLLELKDVLCTLPDINNLFFYDVATDEKQIKLIFQNYLDQYGDLKTIAELSLIYYKLPCLKQYIDNYLEMVRYSYDDKQLQRIENIIFQQKYELNSNNKRISYLDYRFFDRIKLQQEKIIDLDIQKMQKVKLDKKLSTKQRSSQTSNISASKNPKNASKYINTQQKKVYKSYFGKPQEEDQIINQNKLEPVCVVCYQNSKNNKELYIECDKCKHGGHISHILAWLSKFQNCPKIDCPCMCN